MTLAIKPDNKDFEIHSRPPESSGLTFCLVHGSFHSARCWYLLRPQLERLGHQTVAMTLPLDKPELDIEDHADIVAEHIEDPKNTVLVVHSRSGNLAPRVWSRKAVRMIIYNSAAVDQTNNRALRRHNSRLFRPPVPEKYRYGFTRRVSADEETGLSYLDEETAMEFFYHDCPAQVATEAVSQLRPMVRPEVLPKVKSWPKAPSAFIYGSQDRVIRPEYFEYISQSKKIARNLGHSAIVLDGGHCLHLSQPAELAKVMDEVSLNKQPTFNR